MNIKGARILIIGASSGIGLALSMALARKGAALALASRKFNRLKGLAKDIGSAFPHSPAPFALSCDVTKRETVRSLISECIKQWGGIDVLINCAGISVYGEIERTARDDFQSVMDVNFFGVIDCMSEVIPYMKKLGKGMIVNIASLAAIRGVPYLSTYCASKAALAAVSQSLRAELSKKGVSIMIVYPDYTQTNIFKNEKKVGGARRPSGPYMPALRVAETIVGAIENEQRDLFLSLRGRALSLCQGAFPWLVDKVMQKIASELKNNKGVCNG
jgi:short-subunit dehydrogenase